MIAILILSLALVFVVISAMFVMLIILQRRHPIPIRESQAKVEVMQIASELKKIDSKLQTQLEELRQGTSNAKINRS